MRYRIPISLSRLLVIVSVMWLEFVWIYVRSESRACAGNDAVVVVVVVVVLVHKAASYVVWCRSGSSASEPDCFACSSMHVGARVSR
jgi:hypothetical protein